ncbi:hypothetical protein LRAMOSA06813 [Lichtheimia ramosa]|uniref:Transcriptional repressor Tup1 N-terminal domain-containing protein n=1 Tax=Lichtheimia ramosa TaxID=688394 RepID=A0A077WCD7_9FUNG|nr:hypothetical protein LRAMOSA06813 [Lichtheimia ramosa]
MSVYNHRAMVSNPSSRIMEMLDAIRVEYDQLGQEAYMSKSQRDEFEHKMNAQVQEMNNFRQSLHELERSQQRLKEHYEEEIARLRQQLEQAQGRGGNGNVPTTSTPTHRSQAPHTPTTASMHPSTQSPVPPPPNLGPSSSNYFGDIMSTSSGTATTSVATSQPPPSHEQQYPGYPPYHQQQHHPPPPPPTSIGYTNGSSPRISAPPHTSHVPQTTMYGGRMPTSPAPGPYSRQQDHHYGYPSQQRGVPGTPTSSEVHDHRNSISTPSRLSSSTSVQKMGPAAPTTNAPPGALADIDPESVPANMKIEGHDWFALFNPKVTRMLNVRLVHTLEQPSVVCCVKFSADGRYLAAGCNRITYIYEVSTAREICALEDTTVQRDGDLYIRSVCFSPDGNYLATGAEDKQIRIWDIRAQHVRNRFTGHEQDIYSLDFSRDGRIVVSGSGDRTVRIWNMVDGSCMHTLTIQDQDQKDPGVTSVAVSPNSRLVAAGSLDKMVRVWDIQTGKALERLEGHKDSVYSVAFTPDGRYLVSGSLDKTLKLWQLGTNEGRGQGKGPCKMTFTGHKDFVLSVACTADGRWIVSGSKDRGVQFWDPQTGETQFMLQGHKNSIISVAVSPDGRPVFATGSGDNRARIWSYEPIA